MTKQTGSRSSLEEDSHSCGAANIEAGSRRGERVGGGPGVLPVGPEELVSPLEPLKAALFTLRGKPKPPLPVPGEVRGHGSSPEADLELKPRQ